MAEIQLKDIMVGDECEAARSNLEINYPIDNGKVTDWDDMCKLWDHAFHDQLKVLSVAHQAWRVQRSDALVIT